MNNTLFSWFFFYSWVLCMFSTAVYFRSSEIFHLGFKNGLYVMVANKQKWRLLGGKNEKWNKIIIKKKKAERRILRGQRPSWMNDIVYLGSSRAEISVYSEGRMAWGNANEMEFLFWDKQKKNKLKKKSNTKKALNVDEFHKLTITFCLLFLMCACR